MPSPITVCAHQTIPPEKLKTLAADVARLSQLLTRERDRLPSAYLSDPRLREAYESYFLPVNARKIHTPLASLAMHPDGLLNKGALRVLDLGAGPGTALLGLIDYLSHARRQPTINAVAVDQVAGNLERARQLWEQSCHGCGMTGALHTLHQSIPRAVSALTGQFDIILIANALNELFASEEDRIERRAALLQSILGRLLSPDGSLILIEPAMRETARELQQVRDRMAGMGVTIYAPCLFQDPCPALVNPKDWCHEDLPWEPPPLIAEIDGMIGLIKDSLKFSWLVLRNDARRIGDALHKADTFRVVSEPLLSKGKREYYLCGQGVRRRAMRQEKHASDANALFGRLRRGDVVTISGGVEGGCLKIVSETCVENGGKQP